MDYGNNIDTTSLLLARGVGGYGAGYGLGGGYGYGGGVLSSLAHADGTAVKESIDGNKDLMMAGIDRISAQNKEGRDNFLFDQLQNSIVNQEFRSLDRQRDIERVIADNAKEAAKCCCETQKLVTMEANATRTLILEVEARGVRDRLEAANAKITQLETINALSNPHHP